jgi:outer membrane protein OmpA-like peptidoglycan-associated protein
MTIASNDPITPNKTVALTGTGTSPVINTPADFDYGTVTNSGTGTVQPFAVSNSGTGNLTVTSATITGGAGWFTFSGTPAPQATGCIGNGTCTFATPLTIVNGTPVNVGVRCKPTPLTASGTQVATLTFASDTDGGGKASLALSCTAGRPDSMLDMAALAFGNQLIATASAAQTVTITNIGNTPLTIVAAKSGTNSADFALSGTCAPSCSIPAASTGTVSVVFTPGAIGARAANLVLTTNDPDVGDLTQTIPLTGTGIAPQLTLSPATAAFGNIEVGATSTAQMVTATNTGTADLTLTNAVFTSGIGDYTASGATVGAQTTTITAGSSVTWMVACAPSALGSRPGNFRVTTSNSYTNAIQNVTLTCTGQQGVLAVSPTSIDFGPVRAGNTSTLSVTVKNNGNVSVSGITATLSSTTVGYSIDGTTPVPAILAAGASATIKIIFAPLSGTDGGPITITFAGSWGAVPTATTAVLGCNGDGLTVGYDVSPMLVDFGSLRWDTAPTLTFDIINTDQANVGILALAIAPDAGTSSGEFTVTTIKIGAATVTAPFTLPPAAKATVTVRAKPANRTGMMSAVLTVSSDLAMNPNRAVTLKGVSTSPMLTLDPVGSVADFGAVDVQGPAATINVTLTNTGDGQLDVGTITTTNAGGVYTYTIVNPKNLQPTDKVTVAISYKPTVERPVGQADAAMITVPLSGILGGPAMQVIMVTGRGIDRHIAVAAVPAFPDTFRNPGDKAPIKTITVNNTGEAALHISAVMITNSPVWTLLDTTSVDVPGSSGKDFRVQFAPTMAGKAPTGQLTFMNDDNNLPMATVMFDGNGLDRNVLVTPPTIDLGYTGIGIPVKLSERKNADLLQLTSKDPINTFKIREVTIEGGDGMFDLINAPANADLAPSQSKTIDVGFTPTQEGDFTATVTVYLDQDPTAQAQVILKGHGVAVDVHGGGGCASTHPLGGGALVLIGMVGVALLRRRRGPLGAAAALGAVVTVTSVVTVVALPAASADPTRNIDLETFNPTPATTTETFQLQTPMVGNRGDWMVGAFYSYATNPLQLDGAGMTDRPVTTRSTIELGGAYAFLGRFEAGARLPLFLQAGDDPAFSGLAPAKGTAIGDLTLHGKAQLWANQAVALGAAVAVTAPTATDGQFAGAKAPAGRLVALASWGTRRVAVNANLGTVLRSKSAIGNVEQGSGLAWGGGVSFRALDKLWVAAEVFGDLAFASKQRSNTSPIEGLLGFHVRAERRVTVGVAFGRGLAAGIGAPDLRGVLTMTFAPSAPATAPLHEPPPPHVDGDADGDGIADSIDKCPNEPEDKDMFDDSDGCPDPDNDGDGIPDAQDKCPLEAEDKDGFQDGDGCPDKDNDNDGIPDAIDKCPNEPEDKDGFQDADGCPDLDNDGDGIPDAQDKCPLEPETINGVKDDDGCPDQGDALIVLSPDRIESLEPIAFTGLTAKLAKTSFNPLGQLAATLRAHPEIVRIRITAHVAPNQPDKDQDLSDKRAAAVRDWLVQWGIAANRLEVRGFGGSKPLVPVTMKNAAAINARLEFIVLERK